MTRLCASKGLTRGRTCLRAQKCKQTQLRHPDRCSSTAHVKHFDTRPGQLDSDSDTDDQAENEIKDWAIDAICVHLVSPSKNDLDSVLVMLPVVAKHVAGYTWKTLHTAMATVASRAYALFRQTATYNRLATLGSVEARVGHHKLDDHEIAGYRVILQQCRSDRPAMLIVWTTHDGHSTELMHFYPAMGLSRQHAAQQMLLGRMRGLELSSCLVHAARETWSLSLPTLQKVGGNAQLYAAASRFMPPRDQAFLSSVMDEDLQGDNETILTAITRNATDDIRIIVANLDW